MTTDPTRRAGAGPPSSVWASFAGYRRLPLVAGRSYLPLALLARLPVTMVPIAVLTLATTASGSVAVGGLCAATAAVGEAVGAPTSGALADRRGQRPVLLVVVVLHVLALAGLLAAASSGLAVALAATAFAVGASTPQVGPMSRVRWMAMSPRDVPVAFAFESTADEVGFVLGPALVGLLGVGLGPGAPVVAAALLVAVLVTLFARHPSQRLVVPTARRPAQGPPAPRRRPDPLVVVPLLGTLAIGTFFGGSQTALTASAREVGSAAAGGLLVAAMAVGSAGTALAMVAVPARVGPWRRWAAAAGVLVAGSVLMLVAAPGIPLLVVATVLAGLGVGPVLVTITDVAGRLAPAGGAGVTMTLLTSGVVLGAAGGSAVAGVVAEAAGARPAFRVGVGAAVALVLLVLGAAASRRPMPAARS